MTKENEKVSESNIKKLPPSQIFAMACMNARSIDQGGPVTFQHTDRSRVHEQAVLFDARFGATLSRINILPQAAWRSMKLTPLEDVVFDTDAENRGDPSVLTEFRIKTVGPIQDLDPSEGIYINNFESLTKDLVP